MDPHRLESQDQLSEFLSDLLEIPSEDIHPESRLKEDLECDSLAGLEIGVALREEGINLQEDALRTTSTVEDLRLLIVEAAKAAG